MNGFVWLVDRLSVACAVVAAALLTAAALLITWLVIWRALGNSAYWELELSIYMMVAATFLGSPYCVLTRGHVAVDLVTAYLPTRLSRQVERAVIIVGLLVCAYLTWRGMLLALEALASQERTGSFWNPVKWPLYATLPVGTALTALQYVAELARPRARGLRGSSS